MATSLLTNTAAMSALSSLTATQAQLSKTQAQVSSGLAIAKASDNAAYWSIGQTMSAQVVGLKAVDQSLALTSSIAAVASSALDAIRSSVEKMQSDIVLAKQSGTDPTAAQADIMAQQQSILAIANAASFNGVNWLTNHTSTSYSNVSDYEIDTSKANFDAIIAGTSPGNSAHFESTITNTTKSTLNGLSSETTTVSGYLQNPSDASDGTMTGSPTAKPTQTETTGSLIDPSIVAVPTSVSSTNGLILSNFSTESLELFSDQLGSDTEETIVNYAGDPANSYQIGPSTYHYENASYLSGAGYGQGGILDAGVLITRAAPPNGGGGFPTAPTPPSQSVGLNPQGGFVATSPGSSGGAPASSAPSGPQTTTTFESIMTISVVGASSDELTSMGAAVQIALARLINASGVVGALQTRIGNQLTFNSSLSDALTSGIGSLVDADMNVASTRLQALQTQQQLGIQALSMANQNSQLLLKLFQAA